MLLMDGVTRALFRHGPEPRPLELDQVYEIRVELGHIHHTFGVGSQIEVDVTSSNFPRRARNTNSGHPLLAADTEADIRVAVNQIHHSPDHASHIQLPVLSG
jgi:predicted acyl esterase